MTKPKTTLPPPAEELTDRWRSMRPERAERRRGMQRKRREKRRETGTERPHGGNRLRSPACGGYMPPPQRRTRTSQDSPHNGRTCCCRESMETSRITTTIRTWAGKSWTTMYGSVVGAGSLLSQRSSTPRPLVQWVTASRKSWPRNDRGFSIGDGNLIDPSSSTTSFSRRRWASAGTE